MNAVDIVLLIVILLSAFIGYRYGALRLFFEWMKWTASASFAVLFYAATVEEMTKQFPQLLQWYLPVATTIIFTLSYFFLSLIQRLMLRGGSTIHLTDKLTGLVPGLLTGIIISAVTVRLLTLSTSENVRIETGESKIAAALSPYTVDAETKLTAFVQDYLSPVFSHNAATSNDPVIHSTSHFSVRPDLEHQMLLLVNIERKKRGLKLLNADEQLKKVARAHSADMLTRGYFSHNTPEGKDPFERMKQAGITYKKAGENLAYASTLAEAHKGLMKSPSHRAAILNKSFGRIGIGIVDGGKNGLMISQEFRD